MTYIIAEDAMSATLTNSQGEYSGEVCANVHETRDEFVNRLEDYLRNTVAQ